MPVVEEEADELFLEADFVVEAGLEDLLVEGDERHVGEVDLLPATSTNEEFRAFF